MIKISPAPWIANQTDNLLKTFIPSELLREPTTRSGLFHCSFVSSSLSFPSSFTGLPLGLDINSNIGIQKEKGRGLVVWAGKATLCLTKRSRSRKPLSRTHGFRRRIRTTSGIAMVKHRRAKGRRCDTNGWSARCSTKCSNGFRKRKVT